MKVLLQLEENELTAFLAYLGIGNLQAMLDGVVSTDVGIWSLGAPKTWEYLETTNIPTDLVEVFKTADEISLIKEYLPHLFEKTVKNLIRRLQNILSHIDDPNWDIRYLLENETETTIRATYEQEIKALLILNDNLYKKLAKRRYANGSHITVRIGRKYFNVE